MWSARPFMNPSNPLHSSVVIQLIQMRDEEENCAYRDPSADFDAAFWWQQVEINAISCRFILAIAIIRIMEIIHFRIFLKFLKIKKLFFGMPWLVLFFADLVFLEGKHCVPRCQGNHNRIKMGSIR
jgi:hypothetical protein